MDLVTNPESSVMQEDFHCVDGGRKQMVASVSKHTNTEALNDYRFAIHKLWRPL